MFARCEIGGLDERKHGVPRCLWIAEALARHRRLHGWILKQHARHCGAAPSRSSSGCAASGCTMRSPSVAPISASMPGVGR